MISISCLLLTGTVFQKDLFMDSCFRSIFNSTSWEIQQVLTAHFISSLLENTVLHDKEWIVLPGNICFFLSFFNFFSDVLTYLILVVKQPLKTKIHCAVAPCQQFWTPSVYLDHLNIHFFNFGPSWPISLISDDFY